MRDKSARGSLACVGIGITLGSHLTPLARSQIEQADVVFVAASDGVVEQWIRRMNGDVRSLQPCYRNASSRMHAYRDMVQTILAEIRPGQRVCAAFYGHPGVFAWPAHEAMRLAQAEGHAASMEPGISAADCLYADLGIDPGLSGCQHFEATQLLLYQRSIDTAAWLVIWQAGVAGDLELNRHATGAAYVQLLVEVLAADYPADHEVIVYRACTLPVDKPRVDRVALSALATLDLGMEDTLALAPASDLQPNMAIRARLEGMLADDTRVSPP